MGSSQILIKVSVAKILHYEQTCKILYAGTGINLWLCFNLNSGFGNNTQVCNKLQTRVNLALISAMSFTLFVTDLYLNHSRQAFEEFI